MKKSTKLSSKTMICLKKRKNVCLISLFVIISLSLYQLYIFRRIMNLSFQTSDNIVHVLNNDEGRKAAHVHSDADVNINHSGAIKGVLLSHMVHYRPDSNNEFKCLKSNQRISFDEVNDDYCDCNDGTDEPSTTACTNGTFYCDTQETIKNRVLISVPSNKVNDGVCDCCDGSDEWIYNKGQKLLSQPNEKHYSFYVSKCPNVCL